MSRRFLPLRRWLAVIPVAVLTAFAAGCASAGGAAGNEGIQVRVSNNLVPSLTVSISAVTDGASPVRLGTLVAGSEQTFTYRPTIRAGTFRLVADRPGPSGSLVSEPIPFPTGGTAVVEWELSTNNVLVR
jgi:hypothetical protein